MFKRGDTYKIEIDGKLIEHEVYEVTNTFAFLAPVEYTSTGAILKINKTLVYSTENPTIDTPVETLVYYKNSKLGKIKF